MDVAKRTCRICLKLIKSYAASNQQGSGSTVIAGNVLRAFFTFENYESRLNGLYFFFCLVNPTQVQRYNSSSDAFIAVIFCRITVYPCRLSLYVYFRLKSMISDEQDTISCLGFKIISPYFNKK